MLRSITSLKAKLKTDDMARHSLIMVVSGLLAGLFNYLYQLFMGIMLTPAQYGTLFSLISISMIIATLTQTLQTSTAKFTSKFKVQGNLGKANYLWRFFLKRTLLFGLALFLFLALLTPVFSSFLNTNNSWYFIILFSSFILLFALPVNQGLLQGLQRFLPLGFCAILPAFLKFSLGVLLVYLGLGVSGALLPFLIGTVIVFVASQFFLRDLTNVGNEKTELAGLFSYTGLTFIAIFSFAILTNIDVVLVKHYLDPDNAGNYSAISVLGRIAFYAPAGVALAMFPKTSDLFEAGGNYRLLLRKAILYTTLIGGVVVLIYCLFPNFVVDFAFGSKYSMAAPYLFKYGLAMLLFAISFLMMSYFLSLNQTNVSYPFLAVMLLQLGLIYFFHYNIAQVVNIMLICGAASVVLLVPFYLKGMKCYQC